MKNRTCRYPSLRNAVAALLAILNAQVFAAPLGSAFTYQGRLTDGASPASGGYDLRFTIYDAPTNGTLKAMVTNASVAVANGLFTTPIDFGQPPANFNAMWLEIGVRTNGSAGDFTIVSPRQALLPAPYAFYALNASNAVTSVTASNVTPGSINSASIQAGCITVTNVNTTSLAGAFWSVGGNSGTTPGAYLGTTDNQPLELHVNGLRAFRLEPNAGGPNVIGGSPANSISGVAGVIGGGVSNQVAANYSTVGGGVRNVAGGSQGWYATVGGGDFNNAGGDRSVIGGGSSNTNADYVSVIGGGANNLVNFGSQYATIAGGGGNTVSSVDDVIGGGFHNTIGTGTPDSSIGGGQYNTIQTGSSATIAGGSLNTIATGANGACIGGGVGNTNQALWGVIGGGANNTIQWNALNATISGGTNNIIWQNSANATIGGGQYNIIQGECPYSAISGGVSNTIEEGDFYCTIGGGINNNIATDLFGATIAGGGGNACPGSQWFPTVGGGLNNSSGGSYSTVPGGDQNVAYGDNSFAAGHRAKVYQQGAFVWADSTDADFTSTAANQFLIRASGGVGINNNNPGAALDVSGSIITSGRLGIGNGTPLYPLDLTAQQAVARLLTTNNIFSSVLVLDNATPGSNYHGAINFNDGAGQIGYLNTDAMFFTTANSERMRILNNGNVGVGNSNPGYKLMVDNARCDGSSWINSSDRNLKRDFAAVDTKAVLEQVAALPVQTWSYKAQPGEKHLGPVAQDFHAAFGLGADDVSIATVDEGGVALAAIQGLNRKLENEAKAKDAEIQQLKQSVAELKTMVEKLASK